MLSIVIPSYIGHLEEINRFLISNKKHNKDNDVTTIYIIISSYELDIFRDITNKFFNVKILLFKDIMLKFFNIQIDEKEFLNVIGPVSFQSLKKLCGMLEVKDKLIFLTDSETYFIRDINILDDCFKSNTVLLSYKLGIGNDTQRQVVDTAKKILNLNCVIPWIGLVFSYQWCYHSEDIVKFFNIYKNKIYDCVIKSNNKFFFIEQTIYTYLFNNNLRYSFLDVTELFSYTDCEHFWLYTTNSDKDRETINYLLTIHNCFCYSVQNVSNIKINEEIINSYKNFKILTSTPHKFILNE